MCMSTPTQSIMENKHVAKFANNTPLGMLYKPLSGGQKFSDSIKDGNIYAGYAGGAAINHMNKKQAKKDANSLPL